MLKKENRIKTEFFKEKLKKSKRKFTKNFICTVYKDKSLGNSKYAVSVSKKVEKSAVKRHFLKRKVFKVIQQYYPQFLEGSYIYIQIKSDIRNIEILEIFKELKQVLSKKNTL